MLNFKLRVCVVFFFLALTGLSSSAFSRCAVAQMQGERGTGSPVFIGGQRDSSYTIGGQSNGLLGMANLHDPHTEVLFERSQVDFQTQGIGQENCVTVALTNRSDNPRKLTTLGSTDPKHFRINAPALEMLPMIIAPHKSLQVNLCFKADQEKEYKGEIIAVLDTDRATLGLLGRGIKQKPTVPVPTVLALRALPAKRRSERMLALDIPTRSTVTLEIDDVLGKTVRHLLADELKSAGVYEVKFDWRGDDLKSLPVGKYYVRLQTQGIETHKTEKVTAELQLKP